MAHISDVSHGEQKQNENAVEHLNDNDEFMHIIAEADGLVRSAFAFPSQFKNRKSAIGIERRWMEMAMTRDSNVPEEDDEFIIDHEVSQRLGAFFPQLSVFVKGAVRTKEIGRWGILRDTTSLPLIAQPVEVNGVTPTNKRSFKLKRVGHYTLYEPNAHTPQFEDEEAKALTDAIIHSWARSASMGSNKPYAETAKRSAHVLDEIMSELLENEEFAGLHEGKISTKLILAAIAIGDIPSFLPYEFSEEGFGHAITDNLQEELGRDNVRLVASLVGFLVTVIIVTENIHEIFSEDLQKVLTYFEDKPITEDVKIGGSIIAVLLSLASVVRNKLQHPANLVNEKKWLKGINDNGIKIYEDADTVNEYDTKIKRKRGHKTTKKR